MFSRGPKKTPSYKGHWSGRNPWKPVQIWVAYGLGYSVRAKWWWIHPMEFFLNPYKIHQVNKSTIPSLKLPCHSPMKIPKSFPGFHTIKIRWIFQPAMLDMLECRWFLLFLSGGWLQMNLSPLVFREFFDEVSLDFGSASHVFWDMSAPRNKKRRSPSFNRNPYNGAL